MEGLVVEALIDLVAALSIAALLVTPLVDARRTITDEGSSDLPSETASQQIDRNSQAQDVFGTHEVGDDEGARPENSDQDGPIRGRLVVLVHGIRTFATWYHGVREELENAGFKVELVSYERFPLSHFLYPGNRFRDKIIEEVSGDLSAAMRLHSEMQTSVIAHSYGAYIVSRILAEKSDIIFDRIIFCGAVTPENFNPSSYVNRFKGPIVNEIGNNDRWAFLAGCTNLEYGLGGRVGIRKPNTYDRFHHKFNHYDFLNRKFGAYIRA